MAKGDYVIRRVPAPYDMVIRASRAGPKTMVPAGTRVYVIMYRHLAFTYAYLDEDQVKEVVHNMEADPPVVEANFYDRFPTAVARKLNG